MREEDLKKCCEICKNENNNCEHKDFALQYNFIVCPFYSTKIDKNFVVIVPPRHQGKYWFKNLNVDEE